MKLQKVDVSDCKRNEVLICIEARSEKAGVDVDVIAKEAGCDARRGQLWRGGARSTLQQVLLACGQGQLGSMTRQLGKQQLPSPRAQ